MAALTLAKSGNPNATLASASRSHTGPDACRQKHCVFTHTHTHVAVFKSTPLVFISFGVTRRSSHGLSFATAMTKIYSRHTSESHIFLFYWLVLKDTVMRSERMRTCGRILFVSTVLALGFILFTPFFFFFRSVGCWIAARQVNIWKETEIKTKRPGVFTHTHKHTHEHFRPVRCSCTHKPPKWEELSLVTATHSVTEAWTDTLYGTSLCTERSHGEAGQRRKGQRGRNVADIHGVKTYDFLERNQDNRWLR